MKTTFSPGIIVTSKWLNGAKQIKFSGLDEDWNYPKLTPTSMNLEAMAREFLRLSEEQEVSGLKIFLTPPQSVQSATEPDDVLTLKDVQNTFVRVAEDSDFATGSVAVYSEEAEVWLVSDEINGGTY